MTKYLGTIEHNARCFSCLRPDHVDVYDEHVARVDYDALDQQLAEAMDKIRTQGEQYMEMYQLNSDARTRLADVSGMLVEAWTLMVDGKVADDFGDRLQQWIDTRQPSEKRVTTRATDSASAVQSERCCLDYPRCDCNSPEPDGAPALQPCGHPWKAQHDSKCILCSSPGVTP